MFGLLVFVISLATWPLETVRPEAGLDPSWIAALHMAASDGLDFGRDVLFTYGPLGYLTVPRLYVGWTTALGALFVLAMQAILALLIIQRLRQFAGIVVAAIGTFSVLAMLPAPAIGVGDRSILIPAFLALSAVWTGDRIARKAQVTLGLGGLLGAWILIKFSAVALVPLMVLAALRVNPRNKLRAVGLLVVSTVGTMVLLWLATGANPLRIPQWLGDSLSVATGFDGALFLAAPDQQWEIGPAILILVLLGLAAWKRTDDADRAERLAVTAAVLFVGWILVKQGFVRHDQHSYAFFSGATLLGLVLLRPGRGRNIGFAAVIVAFFTCIGAYRLDAEKLLRPDERLTQATSQLLDVGVPGRRHDVQDAARAQMSAQYAIPAEARELIRDRPVHVMPYETAAIWAYRMRWRPTPVFQEYAVYTPRLSRRNVDFLSAARAPEFLLVHTGINTAQFSSWPSAVALSVLCRYSTVRADPTFHLLRRGRADCGPEEEVGSVLASPGQSILIPRRSRNDEIVIVRFDSLEVGFGSRLRQLVYRSPKDPPWFELDAKEATRIVPVMANSPHVLRAPIGPAAPTVRSPGIDASSIVVRGITDPIRLTFSRLRAPASTETPGTSG